MADRSFDVAILGGGLAGTSLALTLEQQGFAVALMDPLAAEVRADPDFDGRAYALAPGPVNLYRALGIWDAVEPEAERIAAIEVEDRQTDPAPPALVHFDPAEIGAADLGWIVEDRWLRKAILTALAGSEAAHLAPMRAVSVECAAGWAVVTTDEGREIRARLVVACDGRRSAIARAAGIRYLGWDCGQTGLVSAIHHQLPHGGVAHQSFFAGGPFAVLPLPGNRSSLVWSERTARATEIADLDDAAYMDAIAARIGDRLGPLELAGRRWAYPLNLVIAQSYAAERLVVAGDAAHGVHPIAGQGLNLGLRDVAALAEVLTDAARRGEDIGAMAVL